jgi:HAD superfamily hydrolase (TIGR01509 family)
MKVEALIFDVDGTLVDTEELHRQAYNQTFLDFSLDWEWTPDLYLELLAVSGGVDRIARYLDTLGLSPAEKTRLRRLIPAIHREKSRNYGELLSGDAARLRPGIGRLIEESRRAGLLIGLAATSSSVNVEKLLSTVFGHDARQAINVVVCSDQVARKKPAPDIYELVLTLLRLQPSVCVAFEDSANGLAAAKAAGLYTIVIPTRWTSAQRFAEPDLLLPSIGDPDRSLQSTDAEIVGAPYLDLSRITALRSVTRLVTNLREAES